MCSDAVQSVWFLRWVPYAITTGHNPFFTGWLNVPYGANLAQNTLMPLLGVIASPITLLFSPIASFTFLAWLAFPLSAFSMFYVTHRLTNSQIAGFIAGLLYACSPYMVGQASNHMMLSFIPLPPLIMLAVWELVVEQRRKSWLSGTILAIEVVAQFLIEPEILAITAVVIFLLLLIGHLNHALLISKLRLQYSLKGLGVAVLLIGLCLVYPAWFMLLGPQHFTGSNFPTDNAFRSDLVGLVAPTLNERYVPSQIRHFATTTAGNDYPESGDYIGLPLLVIILYSVIRWRRNQLLVISAATAFICWVLSLGPSLVAYGHSTTIPLPFAAIDHLPFLKDILPTRFSFAEWLLIPITVALIIYEWEKDLAKKHLPLNNTSRLRLIRSGQGLLMIVVFITLLPRWPYVSQQLNVPPAFSAKSQIITKGSTVLAYPYPLLPIDQSMLWQATNGMRFKLVGGYIQNVDPTGHESEFPALLPEPSIQEWLADEQGEQSLMTVPWPSASIVTSKDIRDYLKQNKIGSVIIDPHETNAAIVSKAFGDVLGPPQKSPGVLFWNNVQSHL
jgi:hypothetical protein